MYCRRDALIQVIRRNMYTHTLVYRLMGICRCYGSAIQLNPQFPRRRTPEIDCNRPPTCSSFPVRLDKLLHNSMEWNIYHSCTHRCAPFTRRSPSSFPLTLPWPLHTQDNRLPDTLRQALRQALRRRVHGETQVRTHCMQCASPRPCSTRRTVIRRRDKLDPHLVQGSTQLVCSIWFSHNRDVISVSEELWQPSCSTRHMGDSSTGSMEGNDSLVRR